VSVERLILENGTAVEDYSNLVWFFRVVDVKMWEIPDVPGAGSQFLRWDETGMVLDEDLLHEFSVKF